MISPVRDPSSFYRLNEELAQELARLEREGHLDRLLELLGAAEAELLVASTRPEAGFEELLGVLRPRAEGQPEAWDHEGVLAVRSQFTVVLPDGTPREVYMPDHICPSCMNEEGNAIDACARVCGACAFRW